MPLKTNAPLETTALTLTLQLGAASTKSYIKAIYLLLLHYLSYLKPANWREIGLNVKSAVSSRKPPASRGTAELRVPGWLSGGKLALGLKKRKNHEFVTILYLSLLCLLWGRE